MRIDSHLHVNYRGYSPEKIVRYLDGARFDLCWLLTWEEANPKEPSYQHLSIEDVYAAYEKYPTRIIPMYAPDPNGKNPSDKFLFWHGKGIKGCGELKTTLNWESREIRSFLSSISDLQIPVLFHMEDSRRIFQPSDTVNIFEDLYLRSLVSNRFLKIPKYSLELLLSLFPSLEEWTKRRYYFPGYMLDFISLGMILEDYPGISFIGHGPLFWKNISEYEIDNYEKYPTGAIQKEGSLSRCLRKYHNLYADISGDSGFRALDRDHGFAREFLSEFEQKVIFGTDNTDIGHEYLVNTLGLSKSVINKIMGENAFKLIQP